MSERLRAEGLCKTWRPLGPEPVRAVWNVSLDVPAGEAVVVTGPSGSGKTTLLSMLGGLLHPDAGSVVLDGLDLAGASEASLEAVRRERIGFVFQRGLLLEHLTARQNVAFVLRTMGVPRRAALTRAGELLARFGLGQRGDLYPAALSAGECQRVAVARALSARPRLVLADEPTAHLDWEVGGQVVTELKTLTREAGAALVLVTHDPRVARLGDRVLRLEDGRLRE